MFKVKISLCYQDKSKKRHKETFDIKFNVATMVYQELIFLVTILDQIEFNAASMNFKN